MKSTRNLVRVLVELSARMKRAHNHFKGGDLLYRVRSNGYTTAIILNRTRSIRVQCYEDVLAVSCKCFVDRIVHHFLNEVVQPALAHIADIHGGTFADSFKSFEDLDTVFVISNGKLFWCV